MTNLPPITDPRRMLPPSGELRASDLDHLIRVTRANTLYSRAVRFINHKRRTWGQNWHEPRTFYVAPSGVAHPHFRDAWSPCETADDFLDVVARRERDRALRRARETVDIDSFRQEYMADFISNETYPCNDSSDDGSHTP